MLAGNDDVVVAVVVVRQNSIRQWIGTYVTWQGDSYGIVGRCASPNCHPQPRQHVCNVANRSLRDLPPAHRDETARNGAQLRFMFND